MRQKFLAPKTLVLVRWTDAWANAAELSFRDVAKYRPVQFDTLGFVVSHDAERLVIVQTMNAMKMPADCGEVDSSLVLPTGMINTIHPLAPPRTRQRKLKE
jgi:hypothetical protein